MTEKDLLIGLVGLALVNSFAQGVFARKVSERCEAAIATEARRAATEGAVHEGAGPRDIAQGEA